MCFYLCIYHVGDTERHVGVGDTERTAEGAGTQGQQNPLQATGERYVHMASYTGLLTPAFDLS